MVYIIDYGVGNLGSVVRMIEKVGGRAKCISTPKEILCADKFILPGVGHFDCGMSQIIKRGLLESLRERVIVQGIPIMGICLGMQLLCKFSEEGKLPGLGFINAHVCKFQLLSGQNFKIPHMGWNNIRITRSNLLFDISAQEQRFYFVHSYYVIPEVFDITIAISTHGFEFCAAFQSENIFGVQFHPEKSHSFGMALMKRFIEL